ncbi:MAG: hypothetical protein EOP53_18085 [Sphingobacteriales bacterium]|nr:MAG: hypothetical protein EOP53_18085 [Sphingobacteriales bacterium]
MRKQKHHKAETEEAQPKHHLALPLAIATAGIGAIILSLYLANRKIVKMIDDNQFDVENYDIMDKPYIYAICE